MITLPAGYVGAVAWHPVPATTWRALTSISGCEDCTHRLEQWHDGTRVLPGFCSRPGSCGEVMRTADFPEHVARDIEAGLWSDNAPPETDGARVDDSR